MISIHELLALNVLIAGIVVLVMMNSTVPRYAVRTTLVIFIISVLMWHAIGAVILYGGAAILSHTE